MKKLSFITILLCAILALSGNASAQGYQKGDKLLNLGIGLRAYWVPIGGTFEYGLSDQISAGPSVYFAKWSSSGGTTTYFSARASYHLGELLNLDNDKLDVYAGAGLGYQSWSYSGITGTYASGIYFPFHVGGRYYLSEKFGIHAEAGGGVATLLAGVALKL